MATTVTAIPSTTIKPGNDDPVQPIRKFRVEIIREYKPENANNDDDGCLLDMQCENEDEYNKRMARSRAAKTRKANQVNQKIKPKPLAKILPKPQGPVIIIDLDSDEETKEPKPETVKMKSKTIITQPKGSRGVKRKQRLKTRQEISFDSSESEGDVLDKSDDEFNPGIRKDIGEIETLEKLRPRRKAAQNLQKKLKPWWEKIKEDENEKSSDSDKKENSKKLDEKKVDDDEEYKTESEIESEDLSDDGETRHLKIKIKTKKRELKPVTKENEKLAEKKKDNINAVVSGKDDKVKIVIKTDGDDKSSKNEISEVKKKDEKEKLDENDKKDEKDIDKKNMQKEKELDGNDKEINEIKDGIDESFKKKDEGAECGEETDKDVEKKKEDIELMEID
uniref:DNA ligase 1-like n=1 Tax=Saccoglossus kowalevskii TaxID=10224 RepID=A0ABM0MDR6_SACKO|nr:PREDICTED: DNA ligase 1-like [Saccoglossus kowalevskii]